MRCFGTHHEDSVGSAQVLRTWNRSWRGMCNWKYTSVNDGFGCVGVPVDRTVAGVATESVRVAVDD